MQCQVFLAFSWFLPNLDSVLWVPRKWWPGLRLCIPSCRHSAWHTLGVNTFLKLIKLNFESSINLTCIILMSSTFLFSAFQISPVLLFYPFLPFSSPSPFLSVLSSSAQYGQKRTKLGIGPWRNWIPPVPSLVFHLSSFFSLSLSTPQGFSFCIPSPLCWNINVKNPVLFK